jgi:hypothetical protein
MVPDSLGLSAGTMQNFRCSLKCLDTFSVKYHLRQRVEASQVRYCDVSTDDCAVRNDVSYCYSSLSCVTINFMMLSMSATPRPYFGMGTGASSLVWLTSIQHEKMIECVSLRGISSTPIPIFPHPFGMNAKEGIGGRGRGRGEQYTMCVSSPP